MLTQAEILSATPEQARQMLAEVTSCLPLLVVQASRAVSAPEHVTDELLNAGSAGPRLNMHPKTLRRWGDCPFLVIRGRRKFYSSNGIDRWIAEQTR